MRPPAFAFVTSEKYTGDLVSEANTRLGTSFTTSQGLDAGDALCEALAAAAGLSGPSSYIAWLSTSDVRARTRLAENDHGYVLPTSSTQLAIASSKVDLLDSTIASPINHDESGNYVDPDAGDFNWAVWTGTNSVGNVGNPSDPLCENWASSLYEERGTVGDTSQSNYLWSRLTSLRCSTLHRLYCFQQD